MSIELYESSDVLVHCKQLHTIVFSLTMRVLLCLYDYQQPPILKVTRTKQVLTVQTRLHVENKQLFVSRLMSPPFSEQRTHTSDMCSYHSIQLKFSPNFSLGKVMFLHIYQECYKEKNLQITCVSTLKSYCYVFKRQPNLYKI